MRRGGQDLYATMFFVAAWVCVIWGAIFTLGWAAGGLIYLASIFAIIAFENASREREQ